MATPSEGELVRGLRDGIGFVRSPRQAEVLFPVLGREEFGRETLSSAGPFVAAVCPHDEHLSWRRLGGLADRLADALASTT